MAVDQDDLDMALVTFLTSVVGTIVTEGEKKISEAFDMVRQTIDNLEEEAKKDQAYE